MFSSQNINQESIETTYGLGEEGSESLLIAISPSLSEMWGLFALDFTECRSNAKQARNLVARAASAASNQTPKNIIPIHYIT